MYIHEITWCKCQILTVSCLIFLLARLILIVGKILLEIIMKQIIEFLDTAGPRNPSTSRQMCAKVCHHLSSERTLITKICRSRSITYVNRFEGEPLTISRCKK